MDLSALFKLSYGMYLITSKKDTEINGQIANTVFQISSDPICIAVSINKKNLTHEFIESSRVIGITVLSEKTPFKFIGRFGFRSGRDIDKFQGIRYEIGKTGAPLVVDHAVAWLELEVIDSLDAFTHTVFAGKLINSRVLNDETPMNYRYYHEVVKGKTPERAATFVKEG